MNASQPMITTARPYAPDLLGSFAKLGQVTGYYDGNGHYARVQAAAFNLFELGSAQRQPGADPAGREVRRLRDRGHDERCPGGATQPISGSNPFLDQGRLSGKCDPSDVPPGP